MTFEIVKYNFERGLWTATMVALAVRRGVITREHYKTITNQEFKE